LCGNLQPRIICLAEGQGDHRRLIRHWSLRILARFIL